MGGATGRLSQEFGWGNAMRYLMPLMKSRDVQEDITPFIERREASFTGE